MQLVGLVIIGVGLLVTVFAGFSLMVVAFRRSLLWGLAYLFVPFASLVFIYQYWDEAKGPFFLGLKGWAVLVAGYAVLLFSAPSQPREAPSSREQAVSSPNRVEPLRVAAPTPFPTPPPTPTLGLPSLAPVAPRPARARNLAPGFGGLRVYFGHPFCDGRLIVHAHGVEILNRVLATPKGQIAPVLDEAIAVPPGDTEIKVWAISTDRTTNFYKVIPVSLLEGTVRTLNLELQPAGIAYLVE